jgi:putative hydroxymethylpyrimidine transport system substrate-binding protein
MRPRSLPHLLAVVVLAVVLLASGCGGGKSADSEVSLTLDWTPNPDHVALFEAEQRGYFAAEDVQVALHAPADATTPLKLLAAGRTDLAISYEPEVFFAAAQGLPVQAVAAVIPEPLDSLITAHPLSSLRGATVGITGLPSDEAFLATILRHQHVPASTVKVVHVGYNLVPSILSGKVDAIVGGYRNVEAIQLAQRGAHPTVVPVDRAGVPTYDELVLVASTTRLAKSADYRREVKAVVHALARGDAAARTPASALAVVRKGTASPLSFLRQSVPATTAALGDAPCLTVASWQRFSDWMSAQKLLKHRVAASDAVTTAYLPASCS